MVLSVAMLSIMIEGRTGMSRELSIELLYPISSKNRSGFEMMCEFAGLSLSMCYYNGVKITLKEVSLFADDDKHIEGFNRELQCGFDYEKYPIAFAGSNGVKCELAHWKFIPF